MERQPRRRRRPALSCIECRRRKIKCDRNDACAHCVSAKTQCQYSDEPSILQQQPSPQQGSSWNLTLSPLVETLSPSAHVQLSSSNIAITEHDNHVSRPRIPARAAIERLHNDIPDVLGRKHIQPPNHAQNAEIDLRHLLQRIQKLEESSTSRLVHEQSEAGQDILTRHLGLQDSQIILNKTRILRWNHWLGTAEEFATITTCIIEASGNGDGTSFKGAKTQALLVQIGDLLQKCKNIAKSIKVGPCPESGLAPPSREVADKMVTLYFRSFESTHRILHVPTFWADYQRYWTHPESVTTGLRLMILLIIAIGLSLSRDQDTGFRNMARQYVHAAQIWISEPWGKDRLNITALQIHCLTILARQIFSIGGDLVWISMGSLMHRAIQIGLHRDPKHLPSMSVLEAELRRRLWVTILELVVQSSLDSAMPPRISFDEFDTEAPSNNNDDEINESINLLQSHPNSIYTSTSMQLILLNSLPIRLRILQLLNGLHSELSYLDVLALSSEITDACRASSSFMKQNEQSGVTPFHRNLLDYLMRRFLIPLHSPFSRAARTNPLFYNSRRVSLNAAMAIISPEPDEGFSHLMAVGGGLFREGNLLAATVISLELIAQIEDQRLDGTLHCNSQYRELLKQALKDMLSLSLERIRQGETHIKTPLFLSMVLAQAEAVEAGPQIEFKIAKSAKNILEGCHDMLRTRADIILLSCADDPTPTSTDLSSGYEGYRLNLDLDLDFFFSDTECS